VMGPERDIVKCRVCAAGPAGQRMHRCPDPGPASTHASKDKWRPLAKWVILKSGHAGGWFVARGFPFSYQHFPTFEEARAAFAAGGKS